MRHHAHGSLGGGAPARPTQAQTRAQPQAEPEPSHKPKPTPKPKPKPKPTPTPTRKPTPKPQQVARDLEKLTAQKELEKLTAENQQLKGAGAAPATASPPALGHDPWSSFLGEDGPAAESEAKAEAKAEATAEAQGGGGGGALTAEELRALAGALSGSEPEAKPAARAPAKPTGSKPPRPASSSTSSGPPGKALTEQELEAQLGDDTYMRALMAKKDAKRAKNVPSANAPPAGVAAHIELTLHKPEKTSVVGVQCEPAPGGEGVLIVAMSQKARDR